MFEEIPAGLLEAASNETAQLLFRLVNLYFSAEWNRGFIMQLARKGNLMECGKCRGICVLSAVAKTKTKKTKNLDLIWRTLFYKGNTRPMEPSAVSYTTTVKFSQNLKYLAGYDRGTWLVLN